MLATPLMAQTPAPQPDYSLWETVSKIERYGPRDRTPAKVDTRTTKHCLSTRERTADQLMQQEEMMRKMKGRCWVADKREDDTRSQVKWACKDGTTAEIATRIEPPNKLGYMMVFNIPNEGALSITAESMRVADSCMPEAKK